jgi:hypothetical protein
MRKMTVGIAAILALGFAGPAFGEDETEEIQATEQPGSEIKMQSEGGKVVIERKSGPPLLAPGAGNAGTMLEPLDDPDTPEAGDPVDDELPGEGPQDLSGPDDDDSLPE